MNTFKLRLPRIKDVEQIWNNLNEAQRANLHWTPEGICYADSNSMRRFYGEFHLADQLPEDPQRHAVAGGRKVDGQYAYTCSETEKSAFRPVLEATGDTDMDCIKDGTIIHMGAFMLDGECLPIPGENEAPPIWPERNVLGGPPIALNPFAEGEKDAIGWMKCGNLLIADRCVLNRITFQQLADHQLDKGCELNMPFDETVSKMFYDLAMQQPSSRQRVIGDVMRNIHLNTENDHGIGVLDRQQKYDIASKTYDCWLHSYTDWLDDGPSLPDMTMGVSQLLLLGIEAFTWKEKGKYHSQDFSPEAVKKVLLSCGRDTFTAILGQRMNLYDNSSIDIGSVDGASLNKAVAMLSKAEEELSDKALDDAIARAQKRASQQAVDPNQTQIKDMEH